MKPSSYQSYPSSFRSPLYSTERMPITADEQIKHLYAQYKSHLVSVDTWEFHAELIANVRRLFGDFLAWLDAQDHNVYISKTAYNLIVDTIQFIKGKRRPIALRSAMGLIQMERDSGEFQNLSAERRNTKLRELVDFDGRDFIYLWLKQPNGLDDMLCTTHFIFGKEVQQ